MSRFAREHLILALAPPRPRKSFLSFSHLLSSRALLLTRGFRPSLNMSACACPRRLQTLRLWDVATGECLKEFVGHKKYVFCCNFSPHCNKLVRAAAPPAPVDVAVYAPVPASKGTHACESAAAVIWRRRRLLSPAGTACAPTGPQPLLPLSLAVRYRDPTTRLCEYGR